MTSYYNNLRSSIYKDQIPSSTSHSETTASTTTNESTVQIDEPIKRNFMKELDGIGRRVAFGGIVSLHLFIHNILQLSISYHRFLHKPTSLLI